ncbi:MAG: endolytic transglycosylase MltG [Lachnospiraceae bacterium]|nr:endolytic transglycosylase MltG [Lachnospiraceae bacterium]
MNTKQLIAAVVETIIKVIVAAFIIVNVYRIAVNAYDYGYRVFTEQAVASAPGVDINVQIPMGSDARDIGRILEERGLVDDGTVFYLQELLSDYRGELKAGDYMLNNTMTAEAMMAVMAGDGTEETKEDTDSASETAETETAASESVEE